MNNIEEKVEEYFKAELDMLNIRHFGKNESINDSIDNALKNACSKAGNTGYNYPDIKLLLQNNTRRDIPVMIEAKGMKGRLEKLTKTGEIELESRGKNPRFAIQNYAVNGALHYGLAILDEGTYKEVIIIGLNGSKLDRITGLVYDPEIKAYYISEKNNRLPKEIKDFEFSQVKDYNIDNFYKELDNLNLTEKEIEDLKKEKEVLIERSIKDIHQRIYDDNSTRNLLTTNEKMYFFYGFIMAGFPTDGVKSLEIEDFSSNDDPINNDGTLILNRIQSFLIKYNCSQEIVDLVITYLKPVFEKKELWKPINGESIIKSIYKQFMKELISLRDNNLHLDFTGRILNSLNDWASIDNDINNDIVLTPRYVTNLMAKLARTDKDSFVLDTCMGSSGFLISAMDIMITDAKNKIKDTELLENKIENIKNNQLKGIELLGNMFILAVLNMILMNASTSNIIYGDSIIELPLFWEKHSEDFPANVFLLNPPYSAEGQGLIFVEEAFLRMKTGYGAILIQENAGSGQGDIYAKNILKKNTLIASIRMPLDLFGSKSTVQTAIYLFKVNRPHEIDDVVTFIDMSEDGYLRQNRKKATQEVNLKNIDHADERYEEVLAICLGKKPKTDYYTEENEKVIKDTISLEGNDWTYNQHKKIDNTPTKEDFKNTVSNYLVFKISQILKDKK